MREQALYIDRVLFPVTALGPGKRLALWVSGCGRQCFRCANPELWERRPEQRISVERLTDVLDRVIAEKKPDGITLTGGEPFDQATALAALLEGLAERPGDILVYSGYRFEELRRSEKKRALLRYASVLIDGAYRDELNVPEAVLRGSSNQRVLFLEPGKRAAYEAYMRLGRQVQNFVYDYRILSVGIHSPCSDNTETPSNTTDKESDNA